MSWKSLLWCHRNFLITVLTPILLLAIPVQFPDKIGKCAFMVLIMGVYWVTECIPLAVTGLIPVFLGPLLGVIDTATVCEQYYNKTCMLFTAGLMLAVTIEHTNLHKRVALSTLSFLGVSPVWIMLGFMLPTWFISMWLSNTATSGMMYPIMEAVIAELYITRRARIEWDGTYLRTRPRPLPTPPAVEPIYHETELNGDILPAVNVNNPTPNPVDLFDELDVIGEDNIRAEENRKFVELCKGLTLSVAYAANIGGIATLAGTPPNILMQGESEKIWTSHGMESPVTWTSYLIYGIPVSIINFVIVYLWLVFYFIGFSGFKSVNQNREEKQRVKNLIKNELDKLGSIKFSEIAVCVMFLIMVVLLFFRSPRFVSGWASSYPKNSLADAVPAVLVAVLLFVIPMELPHPDNLPRNQKGKLLKARPLLDWETVHEKLPWSVCFILGGGFALSEAAKQSGLDKYIGEKLTWFEHWPDWAVVAVLALFVCFLTEITSNSATCVMALTIVTGVAKHMKKNPLLLMFPVSMASSYAFMLPSSTPPNAIAYSYGRVKVYEMMKAGFVLNFLLTIPIILANQTWANAFFHFEELPWAANSTVTG